MNTTVVEFTNEELKQLLEDENSCVSVKRDLYSLALFPYHLEDFSASIKDILNARVAKFEKKLGGILLGYKNVKLLSSDGTIVTDSCHIHIDIEADFYVFKPEVGSRLIGIVNKKSGDHVGCLVHRVFNVAVPKLDKGDDWIGNLVEIGQEILVTVTHIDLHSRLPYLRAAIDEENFEVPEPSKKKKHKNNINEGMQNGVYGELTDTPRAKKKKSKSNINELINSYEEQHSTEKEKKKKRKSKDLNNEDINEENSVEKEKKKKRKSKDLNNEDISEKINEENSVEKEKKKKRKSKEFINEDINSEEIIQENLTEKLDKKTRKSKDLNNDDISEKINEENSFEKEKKKKRKSKELINGDINSEEIIQENLTEKLDKKKRKSKEFIINGEENKETKKRHTSKILDESLNRINEDLIIDSKKKGKEEENVKIKKKKHRDSLDDDVSPKKKLQNLLHLTQDFNALDNEHVSTPLNKSKKEKSDTKKHKSLESTISMADSEDRKKKSVNLITGKISWENITLDLHDSDLEKTLSDSLTKEKKKRKKDKNESIDNSEQPKSKKRKLDDSIEEVSMKKHKKKRHSLETENQT